MNYDWIKVGTTIRYTRPWDTTWRVSRVREVFPETLEQYGRADLYDGNRVVFNSNYKIQQVPTRWR